MGPAQAHILQRTLVLGSILTPIMIALGLMLYAEWDWYPGPQPIDFPHQLHAAYTEATLADGTTTTLSGVYQAGDVAPNGQEISKAELKGNDLIDCQYCHRGARAGYTAGVIAVQDCWACHRTLTGPKDNPIKDRPRIQTLLTEYVEEHRDIRWFKYYDLPEHVKFPHNAHTVAGGFDCTRCHGNVATMDQGAMKEWNMLHKPTMGWCISCHRQNGGPEDCTACHM
ncbi:MAG: hypothetical protein HY319_07795 [Armatimonadetes bacterium]|nr:hypothetical protein [Armatimonadota bacterium]